MKYSKSYKLNIGRLDKAHSYEMLDLSIEGCETKKEANDEISKWAKEETKKILKSKEDRENNTDPF